MILALEILGLLFLAMDIALHSLLLLVLVRVTAGRGVAGLAAGVKRWLHYEDWEWVKSEEDRYPKLY